MKDKLRVGIAGYGVVGKRRQLYIDAHPFLKTVAVCDITFNEEGIFDNGIKFFKHYKKLFNEKIDILFVCLSNDIASEVTVEGLKNQMHVFCEKPPGKDLDDIEKVRRIEKKYPHLKLMYGFNHRYHDSVKEALRILNTHELGKIINIRAVYGKSKIINFSSDWRTKRSIAGGGILLDQGIHMVDLIRLFCGEFEEIYSFIDNKFWNHDVEDNAYSLMKTDSGIVAFLHSTATQWRHCFNMEITLEGGGIHLSGILSGSKSYGEETIKIIYRSEKEGHDPREIMIKYNEDNSWNDEIKDFVECIINNQTIKSGSSLDAFKTMELVYRIYCADQKWKEKFNLKSYISEDLI
jgi:predicted dehydrogenase